MTLLTQGRPVAKDLDLDFRFQVMGMIEWGQSSKPQKIPGPKINPQKNPMPNFHKNFKKGLNNQFYETDAM